MKTKMFVAVMLCIFVVGLSYADVIVVDDHFDDNVVTTNTTGIGTGFNFFDGQMSSTVTEAGSEVILNGPVHGASRCSITSKEGAAIGSKTSRFEFKGVRFLVGNTSTGGTARDCVGVKEGDAAWDYNNGQPTGFWIQFEGTSLLTADGTGSWSGTSVLFYESSANVRTALATWSFDTLNWDSGTQNLTPVLDITLDLTSTSYSLTIEGDTITLIDGSLAGTFASNELTKGYASAYIQSEKPGINILIDQIILAENVTIGSSSPYDPAAIPQNPDGTVGNLTGLTVTGVDLTFKAGADPNYPDNGSIVHSDTAGFVIRLQTGAPTDPNLYIVGTIDEAGSMTDPNRTFPAPAGVLQDDTTYKWQVEQVLNDPNGNPYPAGNPNNISGGVWSFTTISAVPSITTNPAHTLTDASGNATLTVVATTSANAYRWFKEAGATDIKLTDGTIDGVVYSGTQTATLTIEGMASDGSEEYYAIAYYGDPEGAGLASAPSATAWVWYPREVHRWTFESAGGGIVEDMIGSSDIQLISGDGGTDLASIVDTPAAPELVGKSLYLNNPNNGGDPNIDDGQYGRINDTMVSAYADITISAWIYHKGGGWQRILGFGNSNGNGTGSVNGQHLYFTPSGYGTSGQLMLNIHDQSVAAPGGSVPENEWAYVTATLSGNTAKLFVNGEWVATNANFTADPIADAPTTNNCIGRCQWYAWDSLFNGYIADLRIWNYGLSTAEVGKAYMADTNAAYVCDTEVYNLENDFNDDCIINLADFAMLAQAWLDSDRIYPAQP